MSARADNCRAPEDVEEEPELPDTTGTEAVWLGVNEVAVAEPFKRSAFLCAALFQYNQARECR